MTFEKAVAIFFPLRAKDVCSVKVAKIVCGVIICFWFIFEAQWLFIVKTVDDGKTVACWYDYEKADEKYFENYALFNSCVYSFIPCLLVLIFNISIIAKLMYAKLSNSSDSSHNTLSKVAYNTSIMLLSVSIMFLVLTTPFAVVWILTELKYSVNSVVYTATELLVYTNHSINAALYCLVAPKFRKEALRLILCHDQKVGPEKTNSTNTDTNG